MRVHEKKVRARDNGIDDNDELYHLITISIVHTE